VDRRDSLKKPGRVKNENYISKEKHKMIEQTLAGFSRRLRKHGKPSLKVCLLSPHPLVLSEFSKLLANLSYRVKAKHVDSRLTTDFHRLAFPKCPFYIVDACVPTATALLVSEIMDRYPESKVIAIAEKFDEANAFPLLRLGTKGLLTYSEASAELAPALKGLLEGSYWVPRVLLSRFVESILPSSRNRTLISSSVGLSRREREVLQAVLENLSNKEIAGQLNISERTAKFHVSNILAKFGVQRRADLIVMSFTGSSLGTSSQPESPLHA
jgi:DNA-binding NarL/FixJ family response regulator